MGSGTHLSSNSWQQPNPAEPALGEWHKIENPGTGWLAQKTAGWTADRFTVATGGMEVDFSSVVPVGTRAVLIAMRLATTSSVVWTRRHSDTEIANTPSASSEESAQIASAIGRRRIPVALSTDYKIEMAVGNVGTDIYISYPTWYML